MNGAICDLLEHEPVNKEIADKIKGGYCPNCNSDKLVRYVVGCGFHDLCTHFHCIACDSDYCWPIAWEPPLPVTKMKGELSPRSRRDIAERCEQNDIEIPEWWKPIMDSDLMPITEQVVLLCYECGRTKNTEVICQSGFWRWGRGKHPRQWVGTDGEMSFFEKYQTNVIYARCSECYQTAKRCSQEVMELNI